MEVIKTILRVTGKVLFAGFILAYIVVSDLVHLLAEIIISQT